MRVIFMGTPEFAAAPLERLYSDGYDIAGVFTQPDKPRKRGLKVTYSPVKEIALAHGTRVFQPESSKDGTMEEMVRSLGCDIAVVVAYGKLLPHSVIALPPMGCINIHASLLPKYRGAAPMQWAILNGEKVTGVTSMFMADKIDDGDILLRKELAIGDDETAGELSARMSLAGAEVLSETLVSIAKGDIARIPQDDSLASYAPSLTKEMSPIDWSDDAYRIKCKVRGLNPWPVATAEIGGVVCKVFSVDIAGDRPQGAAQGEIVSADRQGIAIACADAVVVIRELQAPGGRRMSAGEYARGHQT